MFSAFTRGTTPQPSRGHVHRRDRILFWLEVAYYPVAAVLVCVVVWLTLKLSSPA